MKPSAHRFSREMVHFWYHVLCNRDAGPQITGISLGEHNSIGYGCQFTERFLQALWNEKMVKSGLKTTDGLDVLIRSPGTWNVAGGPDFRDAVIEIGGERHRGDVEIHRSVSDWHAHGHSGDPAYSHVILHVVWRAGQSDTANLPPTLELAGSVTGDFETFNEKLVLENYPYGRQVAPGYCAKHLQEMDDTWVRALFRTSGLARLTRKAVAMLEAIAASGSAQTLYAGFMRAMGYHKNQKAFQTLAASMPIARLNAARTASRKAALLWGASGLLPDPSSTPVDALLSESTMKLWNDWWKMGEYPIEINWHRDGIRPLNTPERRLAGACRWLMTCDFSPEQHLQKIMNQCSDGKDLWRQLDQSLQISDEWETCMTFGCSLKKPVNLIGASRRNDIVVNVFLPFIYALGLKNRQKEVIHLAENGWLNAPKLQSNRILTEATHRLLFPPSRCKTVLCHACEQQGAMEIYQAMCVSCGCVCGDCEFSSAVPGGKG